MQLHSGGHWARELTTLYSSKKRNEIVIETDRVSLN